MTDASAARRGSWTGRRLVSGGYRGGLANLVMEGREMKLVRIAGLLAAVALAVMVVGAAPAFAGELNWLVNGKFLKEGESAKVSISSSGPLDIVIGHVVYYECEGFSAEGRVTGRGRDEITSIDFVECDPDFALILRDPITSHLSNEGGASIFDLNSLVLTIKEGGEERTIEGELAGEWKNSTDEEVFPKTPLEGDSLKSAGEEVVISGSEKFKLEGAGTLRAGEE